MPVKFIPISKQYNLFQNCWSNIYFPEHVMPVFLKFLQFSVQL